MKKDNDIIRLLILVISIFFLIIIGLGKVQAQNNFFKYSTFYFSGNIESPLIEQSEYEVDRGEDILGLPSVNNVTEVNDFNYTFTIGIRKIARFKYDNRANVFYDGTEENISSKAPVGSVKGFEYLANFSMIRNRGEEFKSHEYWLRYIGDNFLVKAEYSDFQDVQLRHYGLDVRARYKVNKFNFTAGVKHRTHPVYGFDPFAENFNLLVDQWWTIAYDLGYTDQFVHLDANENGIMEPNEYVNWEWFGPDGLPLADTDEEFMRYHFGKAIDKYNRDFLESLGMQQELSAVFGVSYYTYKKNFWLHSWLDVMPIHKGLSDYSFASLDHPENTQGIPYNYDWDLGLVFGTKLTKRLGVFTEGSYRRYWAIKNYNLQFGINYLFL